MKNVFRTKRYYWCLTHDRVEPRKGCPMKERLGPYPTPEEAEGAIDRVKRRNADWEADDKRWES